MNTGRSDYDLGNYHVPHDSNKDHHCIVDRDADIPVVFLMIKKIKTNVEEGLDDEPDYRYGDFRDEIRDVERMRTIGGNYGTKGKEEKSKEKADTS